MSYFKPLSLLLILSTLFQISYTQIEAPKEEPLEFPFEEEPHYVDGKHNPSHQHSNEELQKHKEIFDSYDLNKDGLIDAQEIRETLSGVSDAEMSDLFDFADQDQDGAINFEEFLINAFDIEDGEDLHESNTNIKEEV